MGCARGIYREGKLFVHLGSDLGFEYEGNIVIVGVDMLCIFNEAFGNVWSSFLFN